MCIEGQSCDKLYAMDASKLIKNKTHSGVLLGAFIVPYKQLLMYVNVPPGGRVLNKGGRKCDVVC